jgi:hypothetical protein
VIDARKTARRLRPQQTVSVRDDPNPECHPQIRKPLPVIAGQRL